MSKGDWIEPFVEAGGKALGRFLFPRSGNYADQISWPWLVGIALALVAVAACRGARAAEFADEAQEACAKRMRALSFAYWFSWAGLAWSVFFFRFGRAV